MVNLPGPHVKLPNKKRNILNHYLAHLSQNLTLKEFQFVNDLLETDNKVDSKNKEIRTH